MIASPTTRVVERDAHELERLANSLRGRAGTVITTSTWSEAVLRAAEEEPDLIFVSVPIPGRPASSLVRDLRSREILSRVAFMVAPSDVPDIAGAFDDRPVIALRKPVDRADLLSLLTLIAT